MFTLCGLPALITRHEDGLPEGACELVTRSGVTGQAATALLSAPLIFAAWRQGTLVGLAGVTGLTAQGPVIHPDFRGLGIGRYLAGTCDQQIGAL